MEMLPTKKWGNSNELRLPKYIMEYLEIHTEDKVKIIQEEKNGKKRLIIEISFFLALNRQKVMQLKRDDRL
ncbi:Prevent host death protein, Phd antitoxin [Enterococcus mundtii 3F]|uniref:AbrB/MazE/SpoVT family DNA-binding domain-containing protein n=1 Tax=Enterococcus mundtii TaxID=53346 RepID=UPI00280B178D|nr:hypothetical protein [Enterococcus mundtii]MDA9460165.1 Prevent host death protein, Phd antitoxin [Enterococcus mundtii 3F]